MEKISEGFVNDLIVHHKPQNRNKDEHEDFEALVESLLKKAPVAVSITHFCSYLESNGKGTYAPSERELERYEHEIFNFHTVLLTGYGIDENGMPYWEIQDSYGDGWGDDGFVRVARHKCLIEEVVELKV